MLPLLAERLSAFCRDLGAGSFGPERLSYLGVVGPLWEHVTTFLVFPDGRDRPFLRAKIARDDIGRRQLLRERNVFEALTAARSPFLAACLPAQLMCEEVGGHVVSVERAPAAVQAWRGQPRPPIGAFLEAVEGCSSWLIAFQRETKYLTGADEGRTPSAAERLSAFRTHFAVTPEAESWLSGLAESEGGPWEPAFSHGDMRGSNVAGVGKDLQVCNWYWADMRPPLHDFFTFLLAGGEPERRGHPRSLVAWMRALFLENTPYSQIVWSSLDQYCNSSGLPAEAVWCGLGMFLVDSALWDREISREAAEAGLRRAPGEDLWVEAFEHLARAVQFPSNGRQAVAAGFRLTVGRGGQS